jgi:hypothetical protein
MNKKLKKRCDELFALGLKYNGTSYVYDGRVVYVEVHHLDILTYDDKKWENIINHIKNVIK